MSEVVAKAGWHWADSHDCPPARSRESGNPAGGLPRTGSPACAGTSEEIKLISACSNSLFCFGLGYSAKALADRLRARGWTVAGTSREGAGGTLAFDGERDLPGDALDGVTHVLVSAPPDARGDPVLRRCRDELVSRAEQLAWVGYLSTTGVYGDHGGGWVDEETPPAPLSERALRRSQAEDGWLALARDGVPVHVFRLAGIYGPGRNQLDAVLNGTAKRIIKRNQVFSRIHVEDIAGILQASMARPDPGRVYNVADDEPAPPQDVVAFAAELLGRPAPPEISYDEAEMSPMARSFYDESKRVDNRRIKEELGYTLVYPTYREGLKALHRTAPRGARPPR